MSDTYRPGTLGAEIAAANVDPANLAAFGELLARYDPDSRTVRQLRATLAHFGMPSALAHVPGTECQVCGAIPGFTHHTGCENGRPDLGKITLKSVVTASNDATRAEREARMARDADPVAAAKLDYDVAMAMARATEELAIQRAIDARTRAEENAATSYRAACERHDVIVAAHRAEISRYASMGDEALIRLLKMETFRLSRTAGRMRADTRAETSVKVNAMRAELTRRGVEIPVWRFQDRTATS